MARSTSLRKWRCFYVPATVALLFAHMASADAGTMSQDIMAMAGYGIQKECARNCIVFEGVCDSDYVGEAIGCSDQNQCNNFAINNCYCRQDLQNPALNYISSCVKAKCRVGDNALDVSTATGFYASYCSAKGYAAPTQPAPVTAAQTASHSGKTSLPTAQSAQDVSSPQETGPSSPETTSPSPSSNKPSITSIIGIAAGAVAGVVLLIFAVFMLYRWIKRRDEAQRLQQLAQQQQPPPTYQAPSFPMEHFAPKPYFPTPPQSELSPDDSASSVGYRPAPTLVSALPGMGRQ